MDGTLGASSVFVGSDLNSDLRKSAAFWILLRTSAPQARSMLFSSLVILKEFKLLQRAETTVDRFCNNDVWNPLLLEKRW